MVNEFFTKEGWLTRYALSCGYKHSQERGDGQDVELTCINTEIPTYLVCRYDGPERTFESYTHSLVFARRLFCDAMGEPIKYRFERNPNVNRAVIK